MNLTYSSNAPKISKVALEELLFFNERQHLVREGIANSLETFGHPHLAETEEGWSVRVGTRDAQTIFAFDKRRPVEHPVGVVVFVRPAPSDIVIVHLAVHPNYAWKRGNTGVGLGVTLIEKVKEIVSRIVGVERILFFYRKQVEIRVRETRKRNESSPALVIH